MYIFLAKIFRMGFLNGFKKAHSDVIVDGIWEDY